jgi:hypothetical protein
MSIIPPNGKNFPTPRVCPLCGGKLHKHGKRRRHIIKKGKKRGLSYQDFVVPHAARH